MFDTPEIVGTAISSLLALCLLALGLFMAVVPWLTPRGEAFGVTVPPIAHTDPRIRKFRICYAIAMTVLTLIATVASTIGSLNLMLYTVATLVLPFAGFLGMLVCRQRVRVLKEREGWRAEGNRSTAVALSGSAPTPLPLRWNLLYVPIILATIVLIAVLYPHMPERIPMHAGFDGQVNRWVEKSVGVAVFPVAVQVFMAVCLVLCHVIIVRSKRPQAGPRPVAGALAYGRFAQLESIVMLGTGLAIVASLSLMVLSDAGLMSLNLAGISVVVIALVALGVSLGVAVWCGQSGARLVDGAGTAVGAGTVTSAGTAVAAAGTGIAGVEAVAGAAADARAAAGASAAADGTDKLVTDDDVHWKAGVFYVNREDPSAFVPKRFGVGWTLNMGNWRVWVVLVLFVAVTVGFVALCLALVG